MKRSSPYSTRDQAVLDSDTRREEAARWFITLQNAELSERVLKSWKEWEAIPANREAFDAVERVWQLVDNIPELPAATSEELAQDRYDGSVPVSRWGAAQEGARSSMPLPQRFWPRTFGRAAAAAIVIVGILSMPLVQTLIQRFTSAPDRTVVVATGLGEHKQILFEDGSRIYLGAETSVTANFTRTTRSVELDHGEAAFTVARDPQRPFTVTAGQGTITAVGTAFNVQRRQDSNVTVTVTEGIVEVAPISTDLDKRGAVSDADERSDVLRISRGQEVAYDVRGSVGPVREADVLSTLAWRNGRFTYSGEPLRHVIEDVNRYSHHQLMIGDAAVGDLLYSGTLFTSDIQEWISGLEKTYPQIEVTSMPNARLLLRARDVGN
jgi:transmembrane sensor